MIRLIASTILIALAARLMAAAQFFFRIAGRIDPVDWENEKMKVRANLQAARMEDAMNKHKMDENAKIITTYPSPLADVFLGVGPHDPPSPQVIGYPSVLPTPRVVPEGVTAFARAAGIPFFRPDEPLPDHGIGDYYIAGDDGNWYSLMEIIAALCRAVNEKGRT